MKLAQHSLVFACLCLMASACARANPPASSGPLTVYPPNIATLAPASESTSSQPTKVPDRVDVQPRQKPSDPVIGCMNEDECLFVSPDYPDNPIGTAKLQGYYTQVEKSAFGETKKCDILVVTSGSQILTRAFLSQVDQGNKINSKNEKNQLLLTIDLAPLTAQEKQKIVSSTDKAPIDLLVLSKQQAGRGAPVCYSFVSIIKVVMSIWYLSQ